jgi:hypothetical protein
MRRRLIFIAPLAIVGILLFAALGGEIVRRLWNWLLPSIFGWPPITFWQALGLLVLCRILFGGVGGRGGYRGSARRRMSERWQAMTPEERQEFRQRVRRRCGFDSSADARTGGGPGS